jgi:hypothetical protein
MNHWFVSPDLAHVAQYAVMQVVVMQVVAEYPGTVTLTLDANFPFLVSVPLLPHLSQNDCRKLDFANYYADDTRDCLQGKTRSALGSWAFEVPHDTTCPPALLTLRWGMAWLQPLWPPPDGTRTRRCTVTRSCDRLNSFKGFYRTSIRCNTRC